MGSILVWLMGHEAMLAAFLVSILDYVFTVNPAAKSNSILEWLFSLLQSVANVVPPSLGAKKPRL